MARGGEHADRFDVYGLEMPADTTREERVRRCIEHQKGEIKARNATGNTDYYIQKISGCDSYQRSIFAIVEAESDSEDGGRFLVIRYDLQPIDEDDEDEIEVELPEVWSRGLGDMTDLGQCLFEQNLEQAWFYETYVHDGLIQEELAHTSRKGDQAHNVGKMHLAPAHKIIATFTDLDCSLTSNVKATDGCI